MFQGTRPGEVSKGRHCCLADGGDGVNSKPARLNPKRAAPKILQDLIATRRFPVRQGSNVKGNGADGGKADPSHRSRNARAGSG